MAPVDEAELERLEADSYRAIGRYVVKFSLLIYQMRGLITQALTQHERLGDLALGQATGQQIADSFFGSCRYLGELDSAERRAERNIANQLQTETGERIVERNKIMHGDWWVGGDPKGAAKSSKALAL